MRIPVYLTEFLATLDGDSGVIWRLLHAAALSLPGLVPGLFSSPPLRWGLAGGQPDASVGEPCSCCKALAGAAASSSIQHAAARPGRAACDGAAGAHGPGRQAGPPHLSFPPSSGGGLLRFRWDSPLSSMR